MEKITITRITPLTKDKAGNELKTKEGRPYTRLLINCNEYGDKPLSGFQNAGNNNWQVGQQVEVDVERVMVGSNEYLNFKTPDRLAILEQKVAKLFEMHEALRQLVIPTPTTATPQETLDNIEYPEPPTGEPSF